MINAFLGLICAWFGDISFYSLCKAVILVTMVKFKAIY